MPEPTKKGRGSHSLCACKIKACKRKIQQSLLEACNNLIAKKNVRLFCDWLGIFIFSLSLRGAQSDDSITMASLSVGILNVTLTVVLYY